MLVQGIEEAICEALGRVLEVLAIIAFHDVPIGRTEW
jgi:hypothetical protein